MGTAALVLVLCLAVFAGTSRLVGTGRLPFLRPSVPVDPPTPEHLPPAVAGLLASGAVEYTAVSETALALVRAGWLRSERRDDGTLVVDLSGQPGSAPLRPFEDLVVQRVAHRTGLPDGMPLSALGAGEDYDAWRTSFARSVRDEAAALGLLRSEVRGLVRAVALPASAVAAGGVCYFLSRVPDHLPGFVGYVLTFLIWSVLLDPIRTAAVGPHLTGPGRAALARWRTEARTARLRLPAADDAGTPEAPAAAADTATAEAADTAEAGDSGEAQAPDLPEGQAWSSYGGRLRVVGVGALGPAYDGGRPGFLVVLASVAAVATVVLALLVHGPGHAAATALPAVVLAVALVRWIPARRRLLALPAEEVFTGAVVRRWTDDVRSDGHASISHCCSVDDGVSVTSRSFTIDRTLWERLRVGDTVEVRWNPRRQRLGSITLLTPPAPEPSARVPLPSGPSDTV